MEDQSVITRTITTAPEVYAPGHLGELTQVLDFALIDAAAEETGTVQRRVRLLPTRVVIYFVLTLALFEHAAYRQVWAKLVTGLDGLVLRCPTASALTWGRRRVGPKPLRAVFDMISGPVAIPGTPGVFWRGLRLLALDATTLAVPDTPRLRGRYRKRGGAEHTFSYPLLRLTVIVECGTRALVGAVFGPESDGETTYAHRLVGQVGLLGKGHLLLADAGYDSWRLLAQIAETGAEFLCRSSAARNPIILHRLPDGSYLANLGNGKLPVRVIEAWITATRADGTQITEPWRLITSLRDHTRYPAGDLITLYHQRWHAETTYLSIKSTILHGRVLRSHHPDSIDQEVWAILAVYQAIVRTTVDALTAQPDFPPDRISFTIALDTARNQVIAAAGINPTHPTLIGAIGRAVLAQPNAPIRHRIKARHRKRANTKYKNLTNASTTSQTYTITTTIQIMEDGLTARSRR